MKRYTKTSSLPGALSAAIVLLMLVALSSCTKESVGNAMPGGDGIQVRVSFPRSEVTRATTGGTEVGTAAENRLDMVTILVFSGDGSKLETVFSEDVTSANTSLPTTQPKWATDQTLIVSPVISPQNSKKIYAIANWSKTTFDKATYTETMLKEEITTITLVAAINDAAAYPMLMSGSKAVASLTSEFYNVTVDMARQSSKINAQLTIPVSVQSYMPQIEWQTEQMTITVVNVPNKSYIVGRNTSPVGTALLNSTPIAVNDSKPAAGDQTVPATRELKWSERVYITENPVTGTTQAAKDVSTYIIVQLPYKNRITGVVDHDNYYKLHVNDTRDAASPHKVLRNTIYSFNIRILGMGLPINNLVPDVGIDDQLTVNSWEKGEMGDVDVPLNYFNIDRTYCVFQSTETSVQSTIATNVADWKLVKADGTTIVSFAEGKTVSAPIDGITYTLGGSAAAATVTVSKPIDIMNFPTQKLFFIAKNLKVPFTVAFDNGFIPSSVLLAAGWPADKLPARGLQIAKRGNKILPTGVAQPKDLQLNWKVDNSGTPNTFSLELGMGESNTNAMNVSQHPVAKYCRDMGPGWFIPTKKEWDLIYSHESSFGSSYKFLRLPLYYWSSTEEGSGAAKVINVTDGTWNFSYKLYRIPYSTRCVKKI